MLSKMNLFLLCFFIITLNYVDALCPSDPNEQFCFDQTNCCANFPVSPPIFLADWENCTIFYTCGGSPAPVEVRACINSGTFFNPSTCQCQAANPGCPRGPVPTSGTSGTTTRPTGTTPGPIGPSSSPLPSTWSSWWTTSGTTPPPSDGNCTEDGIYFIPYPGDCSRYMICFHYVLLPDIEICPDGTLFDPEAGECNREDLVTCEPTCPLDSVVYFPHKNCSLYWLCVWGEASLRICPEDMVFDPKLNNCNNEDFVFCPNLCSSTIPIENWPHSSDCAKYWHCVYGDPTLISCAEGEIFDPDLGRCSNGDCGSGGGSLAEFN